MAVILMSLVCCLFFIGEAEAKDLGVQGHLFSIEEEDLLDSLKTKAGMLTNEEIEGVRMKIQNQYRSYLEEPSPIEGLSDARVYRVFYFDPSVYANREIKSLKGEVIVKKGTCFNPLNQMIHLDALLLFDGTNHHHLEWAKSQNKLVKWVLTRGRPLDLEEGEGVSVYFDQFRILVNKFGIRHLPAKISRDGLLIKVEEIPIEETICRK